VAGTSGDKTQNEDKEHEGSKLRQLKSLKLTHQQPSINVKGSRLNTNYEEHKTVNLTDERRQLLHMKNEPYERNVVQHILSPNAMSYGDSVTVTPHEALYTRDNAQTGAVTRATDTRYDEQSEEGADRGHKDFESKLNQEKEAQNRATRQVKRHYRGDMGGQNHDRPYSAGRRRLDEVEGERVNAWVIRRQMSRA
jgi:hypothetical protein